MHPGGYSLWGGVRPASQNPYSIYDQNLRFYLTCLWRNGKISMSYLWPLWLAQSPWTFFMKGFGWWSYRYWWKGSFSKHIPSLRKQFPSYASVNFTVSAGMLLSSENRSSSLVNSGVSRCFCVYVEIGDMKEAMLGGGGYRCPPYEFQTLSCRHFGRFWCRCRNFINAVPKYLNVRMSLEIIFNN